MTRLLCHMYLLNRSQHSKPKMVRQVATKAEFDAVRRWMPFSSRYGPFV